MIDPRTSLSKTAALALFLLLPFVSSAQAQEAESEANAPAAEAPKKASEYLYAAQPEGKTLAKGMLRVRLPYKMSTGDTGFDDKGKKTHPPVKVKAAGGALVAEYGLSDRVSLQFMTEYVGSQEVSFDKGRFLGSADYRAASQGVYADKFSALGTDVDADNLSTKLQGAIANALVQNGACGTTDVATCFGQIQAGMKAPVDLPASATNLTGLDIKQGDTLNVVIGGYAAAVNQQIEDGILDAAEQQASRRGATGMGDTTVGALVEVLHEGPLFLSVGLGMRFPTGKYKSLGGNELQTGRGLTEVGLRTNVDVLPVNWLMLSWQNQAEVMAVKGKKEVGTETYDVERVGARNVGFFYLKPSLVPLHHSLNVLAPRLGVTYDHDSAEKIDGKAPERGYVHNSYVGMGFDLTRYALPFQFDVEHQRPLEGRNKTVALTSTLYTLKGFYIF